MEKTITAPKEIADNFNLYFTKIADNILSGKKYHGNDSHKKSFFDQLMKNEEDIYMYF